MDGAQELAGASKCLSSVLRDLAISPAFGHTVLVGNKPSLCIYLSNNMYLHFFYLRVSKALGYCFERNMRLQSFL